MVNGERAARIDPRDRGLQYGDGVFETMALVAGSVHYFDAHFERLQRGCRVLMIPVPDKALVLDEIARLQDDHKGCEDDNAVIKLILTRGAGDRGYAPPEQPAPNRILFLSAWPAGLHTQAMNGIPVTICRTRLGHNPGLAGIKHLNRLEQVLGAQEFAGSDYGDGIMLDTLDQVVESTRSNIFMVEKNRLITPALDQCGVAGIARGRILQLARDHQIEVNIENVQRDRLSHCDEVFLSNSIAGIIPVSAIEQRKIRVGPVTRRLQSLLQSEQDQ